MFNQVLLFSLCCRIFCSRDFLLRGDSKRSERKVDRDGLNFKIWVLFLNKGTTLRILKVKKYLIIILE